MNKSKNTKEIRRKSFSVLAAAVLTASLLGGQIYPVAAESSDKKITASALIPDNVTISEPMELSNVSLPKSEYGKLSWADDSFVPTERVQSCEVVFTPFEKVDLTDISGYDHKSGVLTGYVTVVVSSVAEEEQEEGQEETEQEEEPEVTEAPETTDTPEEEKVPEATVTPEVTEKPEEEKEPEATVTPEVTEKPEEEKEPEATVTPEATEKPEEEKEPEATVTPEATEKPEEEKEPEATVTPEVTEEPEEPDNIFDSKEEQSEDQRPSDTEENLSQEEMAERAELNHNCNGISVSGVDLPWYVQFRATSGENYAFTNETDAAIFKSYEFELWDLKNDKEYEIPDGQYISVTVPVKEGYEYSVEHLLDNGAMETIIPSVENGTMVFSTHSFSPFGIAGSKPIVDSGITEDGYGNGNVPTPTPAEKKPEATKAPEKTKTSVKNTEDNKVVNNSNGGNVNNGNRSSDDSSRKESTDTNDQTNTKKSVNTGDSTMILPFIALVAISVIVVGVVFYLKKKKK